MTHQSIPIYLPSMATTIEDWLTSLREGSRASHIQSQDTGPVKQTKEIYGLTQCELLGTWDRDFCFWRTCQLFLLPQKMGDQPTAEPWSGNFPSSGIAWNGMLYRRPTQGRPIFGNGGGSRHIPTPTAADGYLQNMTSTQQKPDTFKSLSLPDYTERYPGNGSGLWHTPTVQDSGNNGAISQINRHGPALNVEVKVRDAVDHVKKQQWPTPTASEVSKIPSQANYGWVFLANHPDIVGLPTRAKRKHNQKGPNIFSSNSNVADSAALNPDWVEWLMGLPKGWTSLEPMDPDAFEEWATDMTMGTWWDTERGIPRVTTERTNRVKRLKALGNGIVPASCALFAGTVKRD